MAKTVAEILVDQMVEVGIRKVYGIVGDSANPIVDALRRHTSDIEFVHVRNEEAGAFAAGADAQVSGRPTAVLGSSGPGSLHLVNGLYDCQRNGAPVFAIATHIPSTAVGRPEICASAPAANAPASSLRTWTNSMSDSWRRSASTIGFAESPTMPYTLRIPASTIWSTRISATVWAMRVLLCCCRVLGRARA